VAHARPRRREDTRHWRLSERPLCCDLGLERPCGGGRGHWGRRDQDCGGCGEYGEQRADEAHGDTVQT